MSKETLKSNPKRATNTLFKAIDFSEIDDQILNLELENIRIELNINEINQVLHKGEADIDAKKTKIIQEIGKISSYGETAYQRALNRMLAFTTEEDPELSIIMGKSLTSQLDNLPKFNEENNRKLESLAYQSIEDIPAERRLLQQRAKKILDKLKKDIEDNMKKIEKLQKKKNEILNGSSGGSNKKSGGKKKYITKKRKYKKKIK